MRNELLQERASRQDLECDKIALERQVHTLLSGRLQIHTVSQRQTCSQASAHSSHLCLLSFTIRLCPLLRHSLICTFFKIERRRCKWPSLASALQNKDLKGRVSYLEGSQKSNKEVLVGQLEQRIQELEERLEAEERWGAPPPGNVEELRCASPGDDRWRMATTGLE